jgi:hypothetical protein
MGSCSFDDRNRTNCPDGLDRLAGDAQLRKLINVVLAAHLDATHDELLAFIGYRTRSGAARRSRDRSQRSARDVLGGAAWWIDGSPGRS